MLESMHVYPNTYNKYGPWQLETLDKLTSRYNIIISIIWISFFSILIQIALVTIILIFALGSMAGGVHSYAFRNLIHLSLIIKR